MKYIPGNVILILIISQVIFGIFYAHLPGGVFKDYDTRYPYHASNIWADNFVNRDIKIYDESWYCGIPAFGLVYVFPPTVTGLIHLTGFSTAVSLKISYFLFNILAGLVFYLFCRQVGGIGKLASLAASLIFSLYPPKLITPFVRLPEIFGYVLSLLLFVLIIDIYNSTKTKLKLIFASGGLLCLLALTHLLQVYFFVLAMGLYILVDFFNGFKDAAGRFTRNILRLVSVSIIGLLLSLFWVVPTLVRMPYLSPYSCRTFPKIIGCAVLCVIFLVVLSSFYFVFNRDKSFFDKNSIWMFLLFILFFFLGFNDNIIAKLLPLSNNLIVFRFHAYFMAIPFAFVVGRFLDRFLDRDTPHPSRDKRKFHLKTVQIVVYAAIITWISFSVFLFVAKNFGNVKLYTRHQYENSKNRILAINSLDGDFRVLNYADETVPLKLKKNSAFGSFEQLDPKFYDLTVNFFWLSRIGIQSLPVMRSNLMQITCSKYLIARDLGEPVNLSKVRSIGAQNIYQIKPDPRFAMPVKPIVIPGSQSRIITHLVNYLTPDGHGFCLVSEENVNSEAAGNLRLTISRKRDGFYLSNKTREIPLFGEPEVELTKKIFAPNLIQNSTDYTDYFTSKIDEKTAEAVLNYTKPIAPKLRRFLGGPLAGISYTRETPTAVNLSNCSGSPFIMVKETYLPNWTAVDSRGDTHEIMRTSTGLMLVENLSLSHQLNLKYERMPIEKFANAVSGWSFVIMLFISLIWWARIIVLKVKKIRK